MKPLDQSYQNEILQKQQIFFKHLRKMKKTCSNNDVLAPGKDFMKSDLELFLYKMI